MSSVWKVLIGLALVVPMVAYVAGSLVASAADDPAPRQTIQIREPDPRPSSTPDPSPSETADDVEVITPGYDDFDDRDDRGDDDGGDDDRGDDDGGGDDDSGPGGED